MSVTVDAFIRFKGSKNDLLKILAKDFLIAANKKEYWLFSYMEFGVSAREEDREYFTGHQFRPYNFVLWGTTYTWSSTVGTVREAQTIIIDTLAQTLAVKLKTRTMVCVRDWGVQRRYRYVRPMKRNEFSQILDEQTGKPPKDLF